MDELKLIIAGGRDFNDFYMMETELLALALDTYKHRSVSIVSGMARGADSLAVELAERHDVQLHKFPAKWNVGKHGGFMRNEEMGKFADALLVFWDGESKGTKHMIEVMKRLKKPVHMVRY